MHDFADASFETPRKWQCLNESMKDEQKAETD